MIGAKNKRLFLIPLWPPIPLPFLRRLAAGQIDPPLSPVFPAILFLSFGSMWLFIEKHAKPSGQTGNKGEVGTMEIVEMLFSVRGNTAGAILMEWNTAAESQGSAAMWDSHFRVGGADGTDLDIQNCPKFGFNDQCIAASLMFHLTEQASGYFENVWAWVADHDNDASVFNQPDSTITQISVYGARGMLIESQGPSWFYGTSSEHSVLYNYQLSGAKDVFMGHMQTETPYYQPDPIAPAPFNLAASFANDPDFSQCPSDSTTCAAAWGLRVVDSSSVTIHSCGLYSFFQDYFQDCDDTHDCQERILEVTGSTDVVIFNLFTVSTVEMANGIDNTTVLQTDSNQRGFTTEVSVWIPLPGQDNVDVVYVGPQVFSSPTVTCSPPCVLVFPTSPLPSSSTISVSSYTTSFAYGSDSTTTTNGHVTVTFITTTTTTVLSIPSITLGGLPFSNYNFTSSGGTVVMSPSVDVPPVTIGLPAPGGSTTPRVISLPPWPQINGGPTVVSPSPTSGSGGGGSSSTYYTALSSTITATGSTVTTVSFPGAITATTVTCPPVSEISFATPAVTIAVSCTAETSWPIIFDCPSTVVATFLGSTVAVVSDRCSLITVWPTPSGGSSGGSGGTTTSTTTPLPIWTTWPPFGSIIPVTTTVSDPEPTGGGTKVPCHLWFFFICISYSNIRVGGWYFHFPPGIYPPGPPPFPKIEWPPGFTLKGSLPPWPEITIDNNNQMSYSSESQCETETASVCTTTTIISATTTTDGITTTTFSTESTHCETIFGCDVTDSETHTATTTVASCAANARVRRDYVEAKATSAPEAVSRAAFAAVPEPELEPEYARLEPRVLCAQNAIIYPVNPWNVGQIPTILSNNNYPPGSYDQVQSTALGRAAGMTAGWTGYFFVPALDGDTFNLLDNSADVHLVYYYESFNRDTDRTTSFGFRHTSSDDLQAFNDRLPLGPPSNASSPFFRPSSVVPSIASKTLAKRDATSAVSSRWPNSQVSLARQRTWFSNYQAGAPNFDAATQDFKFVYDNSAGAGTTVYLTGEVPISFPTDNGDFNHVEFQNANHRQLAMKSQYGIPANDEYDEDHINHALAVASYVNGAELGICKMCATVSFENTETTVSDDWIPVEVHMDNILAAVDDMYSTGRSGPTKSIINMSWGYRSGQAPDSFIEALYLLLKELDQAQITLVAAAGNDGGAINTYPALFGGATEWGDAISNLIVVGATDESGQRADFSQTATFVSTYAPGEQLWAPFYDADSPDDDAEYIGDVGENPVDGTSFAAPQVAALAGYLKILPSQWVTSGQMADPAGVKAMIQALHGRITVSPFNGNAALLEPIIWNGQDDLVNCLTNPGDDENCPNLPADITSYTGQTTGSCHSGAAIAGRDDTGVCPASPNGGGGGGTTVTVSSGPTASPTCASECGGVLCTGYWCTPSPTGDPPGYLDPNDPSSTGYTAPVTTVPVVSTAPPATTTPPTPTTWDWSVEFVFSVSSIFLPPRLPCY